LVKCLKINKIYKILFLFKSRKSLTLWLLIDISISNLILEFSISNLILESSISNLILESSISNLILESSISNHNARIFY
jgi:hypothetical protein